MSTAMEWGGDAKLGRQRSCACPPGTLDLGGWCSRSGRRGSLGRRYGADGLCDDEGDQQLVPPEYYYYYYYAAGARPSRAAGWRGLWRRIVKGKRRIFGGAAAQPYDAFTYAQNFEEQGATPWGVEEPENLSRSFSARFANPSGLLRRFA